MLTHATEGEGSREPTEPQPTPSPTQPSTGDQTPKTSPSHATTQDSRDSLEETNRNKGDQVRTPHDSPRLQGGHPLRQELRDAQAAEISALKIRIKRLEKKCKPSISHHRAWLKSVQRLSMKKRFGKKESVSKQGRKKSKPESTLDDSTVFDDQDADHGMEYMETEEAVDEGGKIAKDAEIARLIHEKELAEMEREREERQRQDQASVDYIASLYDEVQAKMDASEELAARLQMEEREMYTIEERSKLLAEFFERRKKLLAEERAAAVRNKPPTRTQLRSLMMTYLKHIEKRFDYEVLGRANGVQDYKTSLKWFQDLIDWTSLSYIMMIFGRIKRNGLLRVETFLCTNCGVSYIGNERWYRNSQCLQKEGISLIMETLERMMKMRLNLRILKVTLFLDLPEFIRKTIDEFGGQEWEHPRTGSSRSATAFDLQEEAAPAGEQSGPPAPKTTKQLTAKRNQERVKSILLLAIPDEYLLKFHNVPDAKSLWAAIKLRFGGNDESKKMQRNVLKHHQLEVHDAPVSKEDINQKFLRSLPPSWSQSALIMRNKPDIDQTDIDDLYNNLRVYEDEMKRSSSSTFNSQNLAFLSSENTSNTNEVKTANGNFGVNTAGGTSSTSQVSSTSGADEVEWTYAKEMQVMKNKGKISLCNKSETDSEISMSVFEVRSSDEEITPANDRFSKADGYHAVPPPITGNFLTPRADISFAGLDEYAIRKKIIESKITKLNTDTSKYKTSETVGETNEVNIEKPMSVHELVVPKPKINRDKVIIEDWYSDDVSEVNTVSPVKTNETQTVKTQVDKISQK
ncbi:hypothetical protein Tco_0005664 [Tanacetum coccineum]